MPSVSQQGLACGAAGPSRRPGCSPTLSHRRASAASAAVLLGIGTGGTFDEVVFDQLLGGTTCYWVAPPVRPGVAHLGAGERRRLHVVSTSALIAGFVLFLRRGEHRRPWRPAHTARRLARRSGRVQPFRRHRQPQGVRPAPGRALSSFRTTSCVTCRRRSAPCRGAAVGTQRHFGRVGQQ